MNSGSDQPVISVITVVRNGALYIEKTIQSVLSQTYARIDFVIVDGKSSDGTLEIIRKFEDRLRWISEPDQGIYDAMNKGVRLVRGEWINFLNGGDTYFASDTLATLFGGKDLKRIKFLYGDSVNLGENVKRYISSRLISRKSLKKGMGLCHQAVFVKKEVCPPYDLQYSYKAEYNWVIDIVEHIPQEEIYYQPLPIVYYALGGFSEKGLLKNLTEFIRVTQRRFGLWQVLLNTPGYFIIVLRALKYKTIGY